MAILRRVSHCRLSLLGQALVGCSAVGRTQVYAASWHMEFSWTRIELVFPTGGFWVHWTTREAPGRIFKINQYVLQTYFTFFFPYIYSIFLHISFMGWVMYMLISNPQFIPPPPFPLVSTCFSSSVSLFSLHIGSSVLFFCVTHTCLNRGLFTFSLSDLLFCMTVSRSASLQITQFYSFITE